MSTQRLFCFGLGYCGVALAQSLRAQGWAVAGTCRSPGNRDRLAAKGLEAWCLDERGGGLAAEGRAALAQATHLLITVPPAGAAEPGGQVDPILSGFADDIAALAPRLAWVGYLSSTGVYGDAGGAWVDETAPLRPAWPRQARRVAAEWAWQRLGAAAGLPLHIFRLAGIYGPGRSALDSVRARTARRIFRPGHVFSRIHLADIVQVLEASIAWPNPGAVYNVADDHPAAAEAVIAHACALLGVEAPPLIPFAEADLSPMAASFWADNKRISNRLVTESLAIKLLYPDYRAGLAALRAQEIQFPPETVVFSTRSV